MAKPKKMTKKQQLKERNQKILKYGIIGFLVLMVVAILLIRPSLFQIAMVGGCVGVLFLARYLTIRVLDRKTTRRKA